MADEVARAIVTAARRCGVHPLQVVNAMPATSSEHMAISRARSYAAVALDEVYNTPNAPGSRAEHNVPRRSIARMVCAFPGSIDSMVKALRNRIDTGQLVWWKRGVFDEVVASIYAEGKRRRAPEKPEPKPKPRLEEAAPPPPMAAQKPSSNEMPVTVERNGIAVAMGHSGALVAFGGKEVMVADANAAAVITALAKVSPALLPTDRIARQAFGAIAASYKVPPAVEVANKRLDLIGLKIRTMPKIGSSLSAA